MTRSTNAAVPTQPGPDPEAEARAALMQGDRKRALSILMDAYGDALYRYCRRMVGETAADDVHQLSLVSAYESLASFRGQSSLKSWLYGIARHRCLDVLRKESRRPPTAAETVEVVAPGSAVDERLACRQVLERCLGKLKPKARDVVLLRYMEGLSFPEIAEICRDKPETLQMRLTRTLLALRKCIEANSR